MNEGTLLNGRYQLLEKLGSGGMAEVFRARDSVLDRIVAIKVLRKDYSSNPDFQEHFRTEARAAANLSHPNIVTVHDFGFADNLLFIVMEHIPGKDLKQLIRQRGRFQLEEGIQLIIQACAGLGYAHRAGLVHCDVKPHNMLVSPDGRLKVTDFGIARALATMTPGERTDVVWGSPLYFSPEQARGEEPAPASDVYSLGVVLFELLSRRWPVVGESVEFTLNFRGVIAAAIALRSCVWLTIGTSTGSFNVSASNSVSLSWADTYTMFSCGSSV